MTHIRRLILVLAVLAMVSTPCLADSEITVNGGGIIKEGVGPDQNKITFSVNVYADEDVPEGVGHFQARFHRLPLHPELEMSGFFSTEITGLYIGPGEFESTPYTFIKVWADGRLDSEEGWSVVIRFSDFGRPPKSSGLPWNHADAIRIQLFDPDGWAVYDTALVGEFSREQSWRHVLDGGNVTANVD
jgi:hypothetical protein